MGRNFKFGGRFLIIDGSSASLGDAREQVVNSAGNNAWWQEKIRTNLPLNSKVLNRTKFNGCFYGDIAGTDKEDLPCTSAPLESTSRPVPIV